MATLLSPKESNEQIHSRHGIRKLSETMDRLGDVNSQEVSNARTPTKSLGHCKFQSTKQLAGPNPEELHYKLTQAQNMMQSSSKKVLGTMSDSKDGRRLIEQKIKS